MSVYILLFLLVIVLYGICRIKKVREEVKEEFRKEEIVVDKSIIVDELTSVLAIDCEMVYNNNCIL